MGLKSKYKLNESNRQAGQFKLDEVKHIITIVFAVLVSATQSKDVTLMLPTYVIGTVT